MRYSGRGALLDWFEELLQSRSPQKRGYSFQELLCAFLAENGFQVCANPKSAIPRQTDILAKLDGRYYLIEAKWLKRPIHSGDIDSLRSRLDRNPPDVVGCIFTLSDYRKPAIDQVTGNRTREILLFNAQEVYALLSSRVSLIDLIEKKRAALRTNAQVWFKDFSSRSDSAEEDSLPTNRLFLRKPGNSAPWITRTNGRIEVVFSHDMPHIGDEFHQALGFAIRLDISEVGELSHVLSVAHRLFGLSETGSYSIHQPPYAWHGFGVPSFLAAVSTWQERYAAAGISECHHSEELAYFDHLNCGLLSVSARQRVSNTAFLHSAELEIRLPGMPINPRPYEEFCRELGVAPGYFTLLEKCRIETLHIQERLPLELVEFVVFRNKGVSGAIVRNPYYKQKLPSSDEYQALELVNQQEHIFCSLLDWLDQGDEVDHLVLKSIEAIWIGSSPLLRPVCTWENLTSKARNHLRFRAADKLNELSKTVAKIKRRFKVEQKFMFTNPKKRN